MWQLVNRTPFAAQRTFARDRDGAEVLVVVVKGTFDVLADETTRIADDQEEVRVSPVFAGDPSRTGLVHESDVAPARHATDVLVHGDAHTPRGVPAVTVEVGLRIGAWQTRLRVVGDRTWERGLARPRLSAPQPFTTMPLDWEHAYGGRDESVDPTAVFEPNPVGRGFAASARAIEGRAAPNLEDPDALIESWSDRPPPRSFAPVARHWAPRRRLAGTFDDRWERARKPLVPEDFDDAFHQAAPPERQVRGLEGGEPCEATHMRPEGPLRFALPRVRPRMRSRVGKARVDHEASLHTFALTPERARLVLVWQSTLPCHGDLEQLHGTIVTLGES